MTSYPTYQFIGVMKSDIHGDTQLYSRTITVMVDRLGPSTCTVSTPGRPEDVAIFFLDDVATFAKLFHGIVHSIERQQREFEATPEHQARLEARRARYRAEREGGTR